MVTCNVPSFVRSPGRSHDERESMDGRRTGGQRTLLSVRLDGR